MLSPPNHSLLSTVILLQKTSMDNFLPQKIFSSLLLIFFFQYFSSLSLSSTAYTLPQQYFINCGSASSLTVYGLRTFIGDVKSDSIAFSSRDSSPIEDSTASTTQLYESARIFRQPGKYELEIVQNGTYVVRFHFFPFSALGNLSNARFSVEASKFRVLSNFSVQNSSNFTFPRIEEFLLTIQVGKFKIKFVPNEKNSFAFVNAMEVFLAPPGFIPDSAVGVPIKGREDNYTVPLFSPLRVIHRINVGGSNITRNSDTLFRFWIPDDMYLFNNKTAKNTDPYGGKLYSESPAATEFDAPHSVYNTAKELIVDNSTQLNSSNMLWRFDVKKGAKHLVRVHFCDIVSRTTNEFVGFNLFIYSKFEHKIYPYGVISQTAAPFYIDFVVDSDDSGFLNVSIGRRIDFPNSTAFLNGLEIFELITELGSSPDESDSTKRRLLVIVCSSVGGVILVLLFSTLLYFGLRKRKTKQGESFDRPVMPIYGGSSHSKSTDKTVLSGSSHDLNLGLKLSFPEILYATKNFDRNLIIGEGGFGKVYEGMLRNGTKVAVKRSEPGHGQGLPEFQTEIMVLSKIRHNHLVSLIGYCDEMDEMILVYEFMEKGTLRDHLYTSDGESGELSWDQRLQICIGAARGIEYLHTGCDRAIIHRDIKSTNILLDDHYVAKVADFGLSRSGAPDQTHVSTVVKGSFGYLDPDYFRCLQLTPKSDVYSFGVVLLEVICGRAVINPSLPREEVSLVEWGMSWQQKGEIEKIVDPFLEGKINRDSLRKFGETVEKCLQEFGADRPNMADVLWDLEYSLKLQHSALPRAPYEDSTTDLSLGFVTNNILQRLPSHSISIDDSELRDESYSFSGASHVNGSQAFSQLKVHEAR